MNESYLSRKEREYYEKRRDRDALHIKILFGILMFVLIAMALAAITTCITGEKITLLSGAETVEM